MLSAFASAFRTPDLRKKLLFTLAMIAIYRLGSNVPTPNVSTANINSCIDQVSNGASRDLYSLVNLFSGGALLQLAVFAREFDDVIRFTRPPRIVQRVLFGLLAPIAWAPEKVMFFEPV